MKAHVVAVWVVGLTLAVGVVVTVALVMVRAFDKLTMAM